MRVSGYLDLLNGGEVRNFAIQVLSGPPGTAKLGQTYYDSSLGRPQICTNATGPVFGNLSPGNGDFTGPASSADHELVLFSGTGGKTGLRASTVLTTNGIVKSTAGVPSIAVASTDYTVPGDLAVYALLAGPTFTGVPAAPTATGGTNTTQIATTAFVAAATSGIIAAADALVFKGVIDCSTNPNFPAADAGWVYKVSVAGKIGGASGAVVEAGDELTCTVDSTAAGNLATVGANWLIIQTNLDVAAMAGAGLGNTGNVLAVNAGTGITTTGDAVNVDITSIPRWASGSFGDGSSTTFNITHGFTLTDKYRQRIALWDTTANEEIFAKITPTSTTVTAVDMGALVLTTNQVKWFGTFGN